MRWTLLGLSSLCLAVWIFFGSYSGPLGLPVPALGPFLHPSSGFWRSASSELTASPNGLLELEHPLAEGEVFYDDRRIPHVFGNSLEEAIFLQAYVTAKDRLWQMDISTRSTGGRLAEILGPNLAGRDRNQIRSGYRAAARHTVNTWRDSFPEDYRLIEVYTAGVNAYIDRLDPRDYPIEFKLLGYAPEKWTPYHSALMLKGMTQSMTDRKNDASFSYAEDVLGPDRYAELYPFWNDNNAPIVPSRATGFSADYSRLRRLSKLPVTLDGSGQTEQIPPANGPQSSLLPTEKKSSPPITLAPNWHTDNGSNNWAVGPSKSQTKLPLLAGDPHLGLSLPSIWYELQLSCPEGKVRGVSLPGLPLVTIGFNEHLAWSMTNGQEDLTDWYEMEWLADDFSAYRMNDRTIKTTFVQDTLGMKDGSIEVVTTPWTVFGPVPVTEDTASLYYGLAKNSIGLYTATDRPGAEVSALTGMLKARNYADFKASMRNYGEPLMNFAYADRHGEISLFTNGFWPVRKQAEKDSIRASLRRGNQSDWQGFIPYDQLPENRNPEEGFVASANQHPTTKNYPYAYSGHFVPWRAREIYDRIDEKNILGQRESKELQLTARSAMAEALTPLLLARIDRQHLDAPAQAWFQKLADWDYHYTADSRTATFFERWRRKAYQLTVDELPRSEGFPALRDWTWINLLAQNPNDSIFDIQDTPNRETAAIITQRAFDETIEDIQDGGSFPPWAEERGTRINHLGQIPGFGTDLLWSDGHRTAPNAIGNNHGPSWRMVVELGERPRAWGVLPGGPSGNPASPFYTAGVEEWTEGRYYELSLWQDVTEAERKSSAQLSFRSTAR